MGFLLNVVYLFALATTAPFWIYKAATAGKYRIGMLQKLTGRVPITESPDARPVVWLHAVSVGEALLLEPLIRRLQTRRPDLRLVLSVTTNTGYAIAKEKYPDLPLFYFPLDFTWATRTAIERIRPSLIVLAELELWPNLLLQAKTRGVAVAVVNARVSERSFRGYNRIRRLLSKPLSAIAWWGAQSDEYADRIKRLCSDKAIVETTGSMKYDGAQTRRNNPQTEALGKTLGIDGTRPVWIAGSTMRPEEKTVLDAFESLRARFPQLRLIIVPRHNERFDEVAELLEERKIAFQRRSRLVGTGADVDPDAVTLFDTLGELGALWGLADYGFVGGSMNCGRGGQSMIEPAAYGVPVCFGPDTKNFRVTVERLLAEDAAVVVCNERDLAAAIGQWLQDPAAASECGRRGRRFIQSQLGASDATFEAIARLLPAGSQNRRSA